jgi:hypothetical protein
VHIETVSRRKHWLPPGAAALLALLLLAGCPHPPPATGPEPLEGFYAKVAALVTTSTRSTLRADRAGQEQLRELLPTLAQQPTFNDLLAHVRAAQGLGGLPPLIEADVRFELSKPEHQAIRDGFASPEVQRQVVAAVVQGMTRALDQLAGG